MYLAYEVAIYRENMLHIGLGVSFLFAVQLVPSRSTLGLEGGGKGPGRRISSDSAFQMASNLSLKEHAICLQMGGTWWDNVVHVSFEWAKVAKD